MSTLQHKSQPFIHTFEGISLIKRLKLKLSYIDMVQHKRGDADLYKKQEKWLIYLSFGVAAIMLLSILGRIFGS